MPDSIRLARYERTPELGPRVLFFSGGSALKKLSRKLTRYTHNSVHIITPYDSGGSSAVIRDAFHMLSVGDLRNRLMALADQTVTGNPAIYQLFSHRLSKTEEQEHLRSIIHEMIEGDDPMILEIPDPMRKIVRNHLGYFRDNAPDNFDLHGASIGNLILTGGFLNNNRHIDPVIYLFSKLAEVRGVVRPVLNVYQHMVAELEDGTTLLGQHLLTGKEVPPIASPVKRLYAVADPKTMTPVHTEIRNKTRELILDAELIAYPMGSFYSSIVANFLPTGTGKAIADNACPKVYIPNTGHDPEQLGMTLFDSVHTLLDYVRRSAGADYPVNRFLNFVILDSKNGAYMNQENIEEDIHRIKDMGIDIIDEELVDAENAPRLDSEKLIGLLLSFV